MTPGGQAGIVIVSGTGSYADPWHAFTETSAALAETLAPLGAVRVWEDVDDALASLDLSTDLVVINIGNAGPGTPSVAARRGLLDHIERGGAVVGIHSSSTAFPDWAEWETLLGGRWLRGTTYHPPQNHATIAVTAAGRALGLPAEFLVRDERYTDLRLAEGSHVIVEHDEAEARHPLAWLTASGTVAYVALGHDAASYGPATRELLVVLVREVLSVSSGRPR